MISRTNDVTSSYWDPLQRCWSSRYLNTTWSSDWWICWVGNNWFNVQPFCSYLQTYVLSSNQQNADYENGKSVASTKDVYNVLPLNWNKKSCYRNFGDSEEMKKHVIKYCDYRERICQQRALTVFWVSYLDMVTVLLNFIYSFLTSFSRVYLKYRGYLPMNVTIVLAI